MDDRDLFEALVNDIALDRQEQDDQSFVLTRLASGRLPTASVVVVGLDAECNMFQLISSAGKLRPPVGEVAAEVRAADCAVRLAVDWLDYEPGGAGDTVRPFFLSREDDRCYIWYVFARAHDGSEHNSDDGPVWLDFHQLDRLAADDALPPGWRRFVDKCLHEAANRAGMTITGL